MVTGTKLDNNARASVAITVTDVEGNSTTCDPVIETVSAEVPETFALEQNYPNPFNPSTTIRFALPEAAHARLAIYDVLGREIVVLMDEDMGPGTYEATFDARDLPSGLYVYQLKAGSHVETRTMTLAK
jgi:hypothetical protein